MDYKAHIWVIDSQAKGNRGTYNLYPPIAPVLVDQLLLAVVNVCVIGTGGDPSTACFGNTLSEDMCVPFREAIDNAR